MLRQATNKHPDLPVSFLRYPTAGLNTGIDGEHFNPEIMQSAGLTELHRRMSWVMAEAGVPWEENDDTWCCPECFILYSLNVFRVRRTILRNRG